MSARYSVLASIAGLVILVSTAFAFDICAYFDPASVAVRARYRCCMLGLCDSTWCNGQRFDPDCYGPWYDNVEATNDSVLKWYYEMGMTVLDVYYDEEQYNNHAMASRRFATMNERWPDQMYKYVDAAKFSMLTPTVASEVMDPNAVVATILDDRFGDNQDAAVIYMDTSSQERTMIYRAGLGNWWGWEDRDGRFPDSAGNYIMPWRFRLIADIDSTPGADPLVGSLVWYLHVRDSSDTVAEFYKFPAMNFYTGDFPRSGEMDTVRFRLMPNYDTYAIEVVHLNPHVGPRYEVEQEAGNASAWMGRRRDRPPDGFFKLEHSGNHRLYVHSLEACDEGYYRMSWADDPLDRDYNVDTVLHDTSYWNDSIVDAFREGEAANPGLRYWGYDELPADRNESFLHVNRLLQDNGLKPLVQDGHAFGQFNAEATENFLADAARLGVEIL